MAAPSPNMLLWLNEHGSMLPPRQVTVLHDFGGSLRLLKNPESARSCLSFGQGRSGVQPRPDMVMPLVRGVSSVEPDDDKGRPGFIITTPARAGTSDNKKVRLVADNVANRNEWVNYLTHAVAPWLEAPQAALTAAAEAIMAPGHEVDRWHLSRIGTTAPSAAPAAALLLAVTQACDRDNQSSQRQSPATGYGRDAARRCLALLANLHTVSRAHTRPLLGTPLAVLAAVEADLADLDRRQCLHRRHRGRHASKAGSGPTMAACVHLLQLQLQLSDAVHNDQLEQLHGTIRLQGDEISGLHDRVNEMQAKMDQTARATLAAQAAIAQRVRSTSPARARAPSDYEAAPHDGAPTFPTRPRRSRVRILGRRILDKMFH